MLIKQWENQSSENLSDVLRVTQLAEPGFTCGPTQSFICCGTKDPSFGTKLSHLAKIWGQGSGSRQIQFQA